MKKEYVCESDILKKKKKKNHNTVAIHPNIRYNIPRGNNWTNPLLLVIKAPHLTDVKIVPSSVLNSTIVNNLIIMFLDEYDDIFIIIGIKTCENKEYTASRDRG